jgi:serine phosphatase RsbU (regulator of sigma subunit)
MFITCQVILVNQTSGALRFANAGHNPPYKFSSRAVSELWATGMPLGLLPEMDYEERETTIEPRESLFLYSHGLVEAHNPSKEMYGVTRLREQLALQRNGEGLPYSLMDHIREFAGPDWEQEDDMTCVVLERCAQDEL